MSRLVLAPAREAELAPPVTAALDALDPALSARILAAPIDPTLADTAAFCDAYEVAPEVSANCIVVAGKRGQEVTYAACVVLATTRADVNGTIRKLLGTRKASFAPMDDAVRLTGMEYGGITPIGLPDDWRIFVDSRVVPLPGAIVGAGIRAAKIEIPGEVLAALPHVEVIEGLAHPIA